MKLTDRVRAALALDGDADPQARDEKYGPWATTLDVDREEPARGEIEDWTEEYEENPLIGVPTRTFTSDILEPGIRVEVGIGENDDMPEVSGYHDEDYNGLDLDDALEKWLGEAGIVDGEFGHDFRDVLEKALKDLIGRRGTAMTEVVYDDREEQERIMGFRPYKVETVTAYTREGKAILLRPDDDSDDADFDGGIDSVLSVGSTNDGTRGSLPETPAGDTACYIQFDEAFGSWDAKEVRFSQDDTVKIANDADTAEVFGTPHTARVYDRAHAIRQQYKDLDQALKAVAYSHFVAQVDTGDQDEAEQLLEGFDPSNPEKVNVVNYAVEVDHHAGDIPDIDSTLKQEIEYVLSAFPVPIYRIGFEGDINRDVTSEQSDDYQRELSDWRSDIADSFQSVLSRKAKEFVDGAPDVELVIAPTESSNPLEDENFDAEAFASTMQGISALAGPGQAPADILPPETVLDTFLGLDADEVLGDEAADEQAAMEALDESDPRVVETFEDVYGAALETGDERHIFGPFTNGTSIRLEADEAYCEVEGEVFDQFEEADLDENDRRLCPFCGDQLQDYDKAYNAHLEAQYAEGDEVDTPSGPGVVVEIRTEDFEGPDGDVEASEDSPAYVVGTEDGAEVFTASDLEETTIEVDVDDPEAALAAGDVCAELQDGRFEWPESWQESDTPARIIALKAWAGLGGRFTTCRREMAGEIASPERFCADFKDRILGGWEGWRQGG